ncbi:MAG: C-type lectin domain-containing protein [Deltaproteobacteria bacterium]|nr:C-type lectin domain-containing protein [Deltaproteobacteria bacterium]
MAYDSARGRVLLFGGYDGGAFKQDIWEWNGAAVQWTERTPAGAKPSARNWNAMAYDSARGRVLLFGGSDGAYKQDTWEWDGGATSHAGQIMHTLFDAAGVSSTPTWKSVSGTFYAGGVGYPDYLYMPSLKTWAEAKAACENLGTGVHLATIANATEQARVGSLLSSSLVWLGGSDTAVEGTFAWVDGTPWSYTNWYPGEPNDSGGNEDCVQMYVALYQNKWNDGNCAGLFPYVCEYPSSSTNGVDLKVWDEGIWKTVAVNNSPPGSPALVSWTTTDAQVISRLFFGDQQTLNFAVTPTVPNGTGTGQIAVDYAEVVVKYRMQ